MVGRTLIKVARRGALLALVAAACPVSSLVAQSFPYIGEVAGDSVRLRGGPSTQYHTVDVMTQKEKLTVMAEKDGWLEVLLPADCECWVAEQFVVVAADGSASVKGSAINLRSTPDTRNYPIGQVSDQAVTLHKNDKGETTKQGGYVRIVPPNTARAFIAKEFVTATAEKVDPASVAVPAATEAADAAQPASGANALSDERAAFAELDKMFLDELAKPTAERDLSKMAELYAQYASYATDEAIRAKAQQRVDLLKRTDQKIKALIEQAEAKAKEAAQTAATQETERKKLIEATLKPESNEPLAFVALGKVVSHGRNARTPATHALVDDTGDVIYYVRWEKGDLAPYLEKRIGVTGEAKEYEGWEKPVIVIDQVKEIAIVDATIEK